MRSPNNIFSASFRELLFSIQKISHLSYFNLFPPVHRIQFNSVHSLLETKKKTVFGYSLHSKLYIVLGFSKYVVKIIYLDIAYILVHRKFYKYRKFKTTCNLEGESIDSRYRSAELQIPNK